MIGILGFQGSFWEHKSMLDKLNIKNLIVKNKEDLNKIDGLIIPGGESTVIKKFIDEELNESLNKFVNIDKKPTLGTCAGIIVLSNTIQGEDKKIIGGLDITIDRNYYGSQNDSFAEETTIIPSNQIKKQIFIRAPFIQNISSKIIIIAKTGNKITGVKQDNIIGLTFHPELSNDDTIYKYFLSLFKNNFIF